MAEPPPLLTPVFDGLDAMVVRLPAPRHTGHSWATLGIGVVLVVGIPAMAMAPPGGCVLVGLAMVFGIGLLGWSATEREDAPVHALRFRTGRLDLGDTTVFLGDIAEVRWDCEAPITTLVLTARDGTRHLLPCERRGQGGGTGVTRKQRDWVVALIERSIEARSGAPPEAMKALIANPPQD